MWFFALYGRAGYPHSSSDASTTYTHPQSQHTWLLNGTEDVACSPAQSSLAALCHVQENPTGPESEIEHCICHHRRADMACSRGSALGDYWSVGMQLKSARAASAYGISMHHSVSRHLQPLHYRYQPRTKFPHHTSEERSRDDSYSPPPLSDLSNDHSCIRQSRTSNSAAINIDCRQRGGHF